MNFYSGHDNGRTRHTSAIYITYLKDDEATDIEEPYFKVTMVVIFYNYKLAEYYSLINGNYKDDQLKAYVFKWLLYKLSGDHESLIHIQEHLRNLNLEFYFSGIKRAIGFGFYKEYLLKETSQIPGYFPPKATGKQYKYAYDLAQRTGSEISAPYSVIRSRMDVAQLAEAIGLMINGHKIRIHH